MTPRRPRVSEAIDRIAAQAVGAPPPGQLDGPGLQAQLGALVQLGSRVLDAHQASLQHHARLSAAVRFFDWSPVQFTVVSQALTTQINELPGPNDGYVWAIQAVNVQGIAGSDQIGLYKAPSIALALPQLQRGPVFTAGSPFWHPGKTGFLLLPKESIVLAGIGNLATTTSVFLSGTAINLPLAMVGDLLI